MDESVITWSRIAAFVRQHTHDVRNGLNSLDLETALLQELVTDDEAASSVERVRKQLRGLAQQLRAISMLFQDPLPTAAPIPARVMLTIWREKHAAMAKAPEIKWVDELGEEQVNVDVEMLATVFQELLTNAVLFSPTGPLLVTARPQDKQVIFELREPKSAALDLSTWGQPFVSSRRGSYGLGLWTARRLLKANNATLRQSYVPEEGCLISQIILPQCE